jgi:hypothetical protein
MASFDTVYAFILLAKSCILNENLRDSEHKWVIAPIRISTLHWGARRKNKKHECPWCGIELLTGENPGFCCGANGKYANDPERLPPLPAEFTIFLNDTRISSLSRLLNVIFSFAALETTHEFPNFVPGPPAFVAIAGRVYHRVRPSHEQSAVRWLLYDGFMRHLPMPHTNSSWADTVPQEWKDTVARALLTHNPFAQGLRFLSTLDPALCPNASLTINNEGTGTEIAAFINYDNTIQSEIRARDAIVIRPNGENQSISTLSRLWEPLAYPLLFPHGTLGWGAVRSHLHLDENVREGNNVVDMNVESSGRQIMYYRARLLREPRFKIFGRLANEYIVDMFSRNLETRLDFIRRNQKRLRQEDAELMGEVFVPDTQNVYLPASFMGSRSWASNQLADSLTIAAALGPPTFFATMTCNSDWPAIRSQLRRGQNYSDIPVVVARVFKQMVFRLESTLKTMFPKAGSLLYMIHTIEFQKRGLPHVHVLFKYAKDCVQPADIDSVISAEIPDDPDDEELVRSMMLHRHPPPNKPPSKYCQRLDEGRRVCRFHYPHALQPRTTIDGEGRVHYRRRKPGDEWVVPHCLPLLRQFRCHINLEVANTSHLFQYLFKYIHKGCIAHLTLYKMFLIILALSISTRFGTIPHSRR